MFERLTERSDLGLSEFEEICFVNPDDVEGMYTLDEIVDFGSHETRLAIAKRLAAYEDSGLSPEELQELAKVKAEGRIAPVKCPCDASEEAQELMNAKADGRLVVLLPIDTEVFIVQDGEILGFRIYEYSLFSTNNLNIRYWSECITDDDEDDLDFWADDIGVAVFLSREAAEKAIAEVGE